MQGLDLMTNRLREVDDRILSLTGELHYLPRLNLLLDGSQEQSGINV